MANQVRLIISLVAKVDRAEEVVRQLAERCNEVLGEPGCLQFEIFRSVVDPNNFTLLELWADQAALDAHADVNKQRAPLATDMFESVSQREDYSYNLTR